MRHTTHAKNRAETKTLLAATLACYLAAFGCVLVLTYTLAALAAPGLKRQAAAVSVSYGL
jgi:hypothetical protein